MEYSRHLMLAMVLSSCVAFTVVESASLPWPQSVLRLFGIAEQEAGPCGPQLKIATPACKVVATRNRYELRRYEKTEVRHFLEPQPGYRVCYVFEG
jgi:hypothetical protein